MNFEKCHNIADFRRLAQRRLPSPLFHYIDGGSCDETTLARNTATFEEARLIPDGLSGVEKPDLSTTVLGKTLEWPVFLSPTGMSRLFHHDGERAAARAARTMGTMYSLSTLSTVSIEEIGAIDVPKCFQVYIHKDRGLSREFIERCKAAKFDALCLTIDTPIAGKRERDLRTGMVMPPNLTLKSLASFATHWDWAFNYLLREKFELANVAKHVASGSGNNLVSVIDYINSQFDPSINWDDAKELIEQWNGPFAIKGVMSVEDACRAADIGATAVMVSNHGGRQLDGCVAPFDVISDIASAVGDRIEVILDGGIRRGTHVIKAIAAGADACMVGRGYLYALAAGGEKAVVRALSLLRTELERDMILMGSKNIGALDGTKLVRHQNNNQNASI